MSSYVVNEVTQDVAHGTSVRTFGPFDLETADRLRRKILALNVDRFLYPPQRPHVSVSRLEAIR